MHTYCFPVATLTLLGLCVLTLGGALIVGLKGDFSHAARKVRSLGPGLILISLSVVAAVAMLTFFIYALSGMKPC